MKILKILLSILLAATILASSVSAFAANTENTDYEVEGIKVAAFVKNDGTWFYTVDEEAKTAAIYAYKGNEKDITIPEKIDNYKVKSLITISSEVFDGGSGTYEKFPVFNNSIESIIIPKTIEFIGISKGSELDASDYTRKLYSVEADDKCIVYGAISTRLISLKEFIVDEENKYFSSEDGVLYDKDKKILLSYPAKKEDKTFTIPKSVERILDGAMQANSNLRELTITENVSELGKSVFQTATAMDKVYILNKQLSKKQISQSLLGAEEVYVYKDSGAYKLYKDYEGLNIISDLDAEKDSDKADKEKDEVKETVNNNDKNLTSPQTGDKTPIVIFAILVSALGTIVSKRKLIKGE